jgi:hypothetical protein
MNHSIDGDDDDDDDDGIIASTILLISIIIIEQYEIDGEDDEILRIIGFSDVVVYFLTLSFSYSSAYNFVSGVTERPYVIL